MFSQLHLFVWCSWTGFKKVTFAESPLFLIETSTPTFIAKGVPSAEKGEDFQWAASSYQTRKCMKVLNAIKEAIYKRHVL
ncbi:hypothetical protein ACFVS2_06450 [Brevibacillus sp. NPDC058079]|uniref:hypothetical protein n=1 Tax=Brevibacillus sp. NPDC058079 TaxID=3346330 RepID=UPI0036E08A99